MNERMMWALAIAAGLSMALITLAGCEPATPNQQAWSYYCGKEDAKRMAEGRPLVRECRAVRAALRRADNELAKPIEAYENEHGG